VEYSYPLRKVINRSFVESKGKKDFLECGHMLSTPVDIIGEYFPEKRRCHKCAKGKPKDF